MKLTRENIKETLRSIVKEESEYQTFFRKALEKAGKSITDMSDEEKKAFFNKIDAAWDGKGEKNEGNAFGAAVVAAKEKGEDEFEVGGKTYKVEEGKKRFNTMYGVGKSKYVINYHDGKKKHKDGSDFFDIQIFKNQKDLDTFKKALLQKGFMEESVSEGVSSQDMDKIKSAVEAASSFMNIGSELKKTGLRYIFATSPMPIYVVQDKSGNRVGIVNKKYASKPDFVHGDTAIGVMENIKSANEAIAVGKMVKVVDNPHWEAALGKKGPFKRKVKGIYGDSVFFTDGSNSDIKYVKESTESVNEGRAFVNAAKKAKAEGKTEFEFNGKKYPVTVKD